MQSTEPKTKIQDKVGWKKCYFLAHAPDLVLFHCVCRSIPQKIEVKVGVKMAGDKSVQQRKRDVTKDLKKAREKAIQELNQFFLEEMQEYHFFSSTSHVQVDNSGNPGICGVDEVLCAISDGIKDSHNIGRIIYLATFLNAVRHFIGLGHICLNTFMRQLESVSVQQDVMDASLLSSRICCSSSNLNVFHNSGEFEFQRQHTNRCRKEEIDFNFNFRLAEMTFDKIQLSLVKVLSPELASFLGVVDKTSNVESSTNNLKVNSKLRNEVFPVNEMTWPEIMRMVLVTQCLLQLGEPVRHEYHFSHDF